jgi:hypothetical protein
MLVKRTAGQGIEALRARVFIFQHTTNNVVIMCTQLKKRKGRRSSRSTSKERKRGRTTTGNGDRTGCTESRSETSL